MPVLHISSNCVTHIELQGATFGRVLKQPSGNNVKRFSVNQYSLDIEVHNMNTPGIQASIELVDEGRPGWNVAVSSDSNAIGWWGSTKIQFDHPGGTVKETLNSGVGGDPHSKHTDHYPKNNR